MATIKLNQQLNRVEIKEFEIENSIVFNYFNNLPAGERDEKLLRAIYIGVLAMMEDRISAFLASFSASFIVLGRKPGSSSSEFGKM